MKIWLSTYFILVSLVSFSGNLPEEEGKEPNLQKFRDVMLEEVNFVRTNPKEYAEKRLKTSKEERVDNGAYDYLKKVKPAGELRFNEILNLVSMDYALFLARTNKFSHTANGTPFTRAKKAGYKYRAMAENIACGNDPQLNIAENPSYAAIEFVKMLIIDMDVKDFGHRHTLMNPIFTSVGFGFGHNKFSYCGNYVVQDFGNP
jgi:uncharacterized protein YkwD